MLFSSAILINDLGVHRYLFTIHYFWCQRLIGAIGPYFIGALSHHSVCVVYSGHVNKRTKGPITRGFSSGVNPLGQEAILKKCCLSLKMFG